MRFWFAFDSNLLAPMTAANWPWPACVIERVRKTPTAWSVFLCADFRCLLKGRRQWKPSPIAVVAYPNEYDESVDGGGATDANFGGCATVDRRSRVDGAPATIFRKLAWLRLGKEDEDQTVQGETPTLSKLGGRPGWIQDEPRRTIETLKAAGYEFLLQFNEESYPEGFVDDDYPLGCGAAFLFARFVHGESTDVTGLCLAAADMAATWQG